MSHEFSAQPYSTRDVEFLLKAATRHGEDSEPDHEVGDLQDFLRAAWNLMTPAQQQEFLDLDPVRETLAAALGLDDEAG